MSKLLKKVSALVLAGAITLSSSVAAFAADLNVYIRESATTNTTAEITGWPLGTTPAFVIEVDATDTIYEALTEGKPKSGSLTTTWKDKKYLQDLKFVDGEKIYEGNEDGNYSDLVPDGNGGYSSGKWVGHSWMWAPASLKDVVSYPNTTMDEVTCADANYAIVLSYESSSFSW